MPFLQLNLTIVLIGGVVLVLGLFSNAIKRAYLSEPIIAMLVGIVLGPAVSGFVHLNELGNYDLLIEQAARLTLAIGLMGVALRLPRDFFTRYWKPVTVLLAVVMSLTWIVSGLLAYVILGIPFWIALLIGAVITPTDPILASTIVTGKIAEKYLPAKVREVLSSEAGANDGLAYLFVFAAIYVLTLAGNIGARWATDILLREVAGGILFGFAIGYGFGLILRWGESKHIIGATSLLAYTLALALVALGVSYLIGSDGLLAVFMAGTGYSLTTNEQQKERQEHQERFQEAINRFFILPIFVLFGLGVPWGGWLEMGWTGALLVVAVLIFKRLPAVLAFNWAMGPVKGIKNALLIGWFGPVGVGAIYYAAFARRVTGSTEVWTAVSLVVFASIIVHGVTSSPFTMLYGRSAGERRPKGN